MAVVLGASVDLISTSQMVALADFEDTLRHRPISLRRKRFITLIYLATTLSGDTLNILCLQTWIKPLPLSPAGLYVPGVRKASKGGLRGLRSFNWQHVPSLLPQSNLKSFCSLLLLIFLAAIG